MAQMSQRVCPQCGNALFVTNQRFCNYCGAIIADTLEAPQQSISEQQTLSPLPPPFLPDAPLPPQNLPGQHIPTIAGTPAPVQHIPTIAGTPPAQQPASPGQAAQPSTLHAGPEHHQPASLPQGHQAASYSPHVQAPPQMHPPSFHAPTTPPPGMAGQRMLPATPHLHAAGTVAQHATRSATKRVARAGLNLLLKKPLVTALVAVVIAGSGGAYAYYTIRASAPTSFVIAT
ncbi:MAG: hypothetical protein ACRDHW_10800, partial [Ktedonobacteraceae bacterium]